MVEVRTGVHISIPLSTGPLPSCLLSLNRCVNHVTLEGIARGKSVGRGLKSNMDPFRQVLVVALFICTASGNHFFRGCQDIDPRCALIDEVRAAGGRFNSY